MRFLIPIGFFCLSCAAADVNLSGWIGGTVKSSLATNTPTDGQILSSTGGSTKWIDATGGGATNAIGVVKTNNVTAVSGATTLDIWPGDNVSIWATNRGSGHVDLTIAASGGGGGGDQFWATNSDDGGIGFYQGPSLVAGIKLDGGLTLNGGGNITFSRSLLGASIHLNNDGTSSGFTDFAAGTVTVTDGISSISGDITAGGGLLGGTLDIGGGLGTVDGDGHASFIQLHSDNDITCDGKLTASGGVDPPYLLLDKNTQAGFLQRFANEVPLQKQSGLALWYNGTNLMAYVGSTRQMFSIPMTPAGTVSLPAAQPKPARSPVKTKDRAR